jgi:hypothetical protein
MKIFKLSLVAPLDIPRAYETNVNRKDLRRYKYLRRVKEMDLWEQLGFGLQGFKDKIGWEPLDEFRPDSDASLTGHTVALDVMNTDHRPLIQKAVQWVADLAGRKGPRSTEKYFIT